MHRAGTYTINSEFWWVGDFVRITSEPYMLHGGEFQDAVVVESGKAKCLPTPRQIATNLTEKKAAWKAQQAAFRRLRQQLKETTT